ncbi:hypothetical protein BL254_23175 [Protofrankia sp. BMG5.30]|uniref:Aminoglycoside phosphotransferase domain-containing protein n=1 Tax=Protofrankia coriariae TaxID=1562887 RepID=A0ABR5F0X1_9ACTN|nr:hypothetical protein FrCorBMG51_18290 [Protofrankia coriariae]ONH31348.1 hypothetical protein BL254_23175 [Protofrankia sp. BMG5.30]
MSTDASHALQVAVDAAGLPVAGAVLVRAGENTIYRLAVGVIARVSHTGHELGPLLPFTRLRERIDLAEWLAEDDRDWLRQHLADLETRWPDLPPGLPHRVVHGDAWLGNVVATEERTGILLDLERCSVGPPEWDLVSTAIKVGSTGTISQAEYAEFVDAYGHDVTAWPGYELLRGIRELRITCYGVQQAAMRTDFRTEAQGRVDCLRGRRGERPWGWAAIG